MIDAPLAPSTWGYLEKVFGKKILEPIQDSKTVCGPHFDVGLILTQESTKYYRPIYRFETTTELNFLQQALGRMCTIYPCKSRERLKRKKTQSGNIVNVIPSCLTWQTLNPKRSNRHCIDLIWCSASTRVFICTRFCHFLYYPSFPDSEASHLEVDIPLLTSFISCLLTHTGICPPKLVNLPWGVVIREGSMFDFHGETFLVI
jgi:hypothetical protein